MNMLSHLQELADAGVNSVKIEGRAKGAYYVASTVNAYRHVLDGASADAWQAELETTSHRPYSTGFYFGGPGQNQGTVEYARSHQMVARVLGCAAEGDALFRVEVLCRNRFFEGEELEVISPDADVRTVRVENLRWHAAPETDLSDIERDGIGRLVGPDPSCEGRHVGGRGRGEPHHGALFVHGSVRAARTRYPAHPPRRPRRRPRAVGRGRIERRSFSVSSLLS